MSNNIYLDTRELRQQIDALLIERPELIEDDILRADMIEGATSMHDVLGLLVGLAADADGMANAIKGRAEALALRKARFERRSDAMRSLIQKVMERAELNKVQLPEATLSISFRKPSPIVTDDAALPDEFCKFKRSPDMGKIRETETLPPGCSMSNGRNVLSIRNR